MNTSTPDYNFKLLPDAVATQDLFEDKTHEKAAQVLKKTLEASSGNITIGLEGTWGSGKSTVINMFTKYLDKDKDCLFLFDAWAHKDDPLRRIFLEGLIEQIDENKTNEDIKILHKEIVGKIKTTDMTVHKNVSPLGKYLTFSTALVPFGVALFTKVKFDSLVLFHYTGDIYFTFILAVFFILMPIWLLVYWYFRGDRKIPKKKRKIMCGYEKNWDFFTKESIETIKQDVSEQGEKTSIEFQNFFDRLLKITVDESKIKRIIIVIDNLDRVDSDSAKSIWSTLQTFFQSRSLSSNPIQNIWFIVPYDREGFSAIWDKDHKDGSIAPSFLDKCFQVRIEVPQPITSGWLDYCQKCLDKALIGSSWSAPSKEDPTYSCKDALLNEYSRIVARRNDSPTPRKIRAWTNQIAINGFKWQGEFSEKSIALYSYLRMKYTESNLKNLITAQEKNEEPTLDLKDHETIYEISGLLFGVRKELGKQILLKEVIENNLKTREKGALTALIKDHKNAFWLTWKNYKNEFHSNYIPTNEEILSEYTFYIIEEIINIGTTKKTESIIEEIINMWKNTILDLKSDKQPEYSKFIELIINHKENNEILNNLNNFILTYIIKFIDALGEDKSTIYDYSLKELRTMLDISKRINIRNDILERFEFNNMKQWGKWAKSQLQSEIFFPELSPKIKYFNEWSALFYSEENNFFPQDISMILINSAYILDKEEYFKYLSEFLIKIFNFTGSKITNYVGPIYHLAFILISKYEFNNLKQCIKGNMKKIISEITFTPRHQDDEYKPFHINLLIALVCKNNYTQEIKVLEDRNKEKVIDFWKEVDLDLSIKIVDFLKMNNQLNLISSLAKEPELLLAHEILKTCDEPELFNKNSDGIKYIYEYEKNIKDEQAIKSIIEKYWKYGGFCEDKKTEFSQNPSRYYKNLKALFNYSSGELNSEIKNLIQSIDESLCVEETDRNAIQGLKKLCSN